jgi:hypothetical protein
MKVLDGEETLKNSLGSFLMISFSELALLDVSILLTPPSRPYCGGASLGCFRTGPVKMGAREAFSSIELSSFNKLK